MPLFEPIQLAGVTLRNRLVVSPMCQYSAEAGSPGAWHLVHLGSRAVGGAGLVFSEATAVEARGRISPADTGLWADYQVQAWRPIVDFIHQQGAIAGVQLAHAGRKGSTREPWLSATALPPNEGGWQTVAPSALAFDESSALPHALSATELDDVCEAFGQAATRALNAGFRVIELHAAHGYLLHQFLSPLSNQRTDTYGGSFENRVRLLRQVVSRVRSVWPRDLPLGLRLSATDWVSGGWDLDQSCELIALLADEGVNFADISSGGLVSGVKIPIGPGYQTALAAEIRRRTSITVGAVGLINSPEQADHIVRSGQADLVFMGREFLRDPYFARRAAKALGVQPDAPAQYRRAW